MRGALKLKLELVSTGIKEQKLEEGIAWAMEASHANDSIYGSCHHVNHQLGHIAVTWETANWNLAD